MKHGVSAARRLLGSGAQHENTSTRLRRVPLAGYCTSRDRLHAVWTGCSAGGCSIAVVNSVGNLGGFAGPFVLGWLHDAAPRGACGACLAQWGGGIVSVGGDGLLAEICEGLCARADAAQAMRIPLGVLPGGSGNALCTSIAHAAGYRRLPRGMLAGSRAATPSSRFPVFGACWPPPSLPVANERQNARRGMVMRW